MASAAPVAALWSAYISTVQVSMAEGQEDDTSGVRERLTHSESAAHHLFAWPRRGRKNLQAWSGQPVRLDPIDHRAVGLIRWARARG
jgi:hypothetical protein